MQRDLFIVITLLRVSLIQAAKASSDHIYPPTRGIKVMKTRNNAAGEEKVFVDD